MDRVTIYPGQIPLETDLLQTNKNAMIALSKLAAAVLGVSTMVNGLAVVPTGPASLNVSVGPGEIYSLQNVDNGAYSSLAADTAHQIVKQGIMLDARTIACAAPATAGQSINYLVQATYADVDSGNIVLPYYNASNPATAYSGPNNTGAAQATARQGLVTITAKAGIAAATGSQITPAPDAGYVGLYVVTVANGQTTINSGQIALYAGAPFINSTLLGQNPVFTVSPQVPPSTAGGQAVQFSQLMLPLGGTVNMSANVGAAASASLAFTDDQVVVATAVNGLRYGLASFSQTINISTTGVGGMDTGAAPVNGVVAIYAIFNPTSNTRGLLGQVMTASAPSSVYSGTSMPAGFVASALISILPTNASGQFPAYTSQQGRVVSEPSILVLTGGGPSAGYTAIGLSSAAPRGAKAVSGNFQVTVSTAGNSARIATNAGGAGGQDLSPPVAGQLMVPFRCSVAESQRLYYTATVNVTNVNVSITSYEF